MIPQEKQKMRQMWGISGGICDNIDQLLREETGKWRIFSEKWGTEYMR